MANGIALKSFADTAIVVIDMLNEYLEPHGKVYCEHCSSIIPSLNNVISFAGENNMIVVFNNTELPSADLPMTKKWGLHAEKGKWGSQLYKAIKEPAHSIVIPKTGYNGFFQTGLDRSLKDNGITNVAICGIHTHVCVLITATAAFEHGYTVDVLSDCVTTGYQPNHDTRLRFFNSHVGRCLTSSEWMAEFPRN